MMRCIAYPAIAYGNKNESAVNPSTSLPSGLRASLTNAPKLGGSLAQMLKHFNLPITPQAANRRLRKAGIIMPMYRPSLTRFDRLIRMYVLTRKGLAFGENRRSPVHPIQTTPYFYYHSFLELALLLEFPGIERISLQPRNTEEQERVE